MKVFVTGVGGQLGYDVINELHSRGYDAIGTDIVEKCELKIFDSNSYASKMNYVKLDITDSVAVENAITQIMPDVVIHCAAWTAVDLAEDEENKQKVININVKGTESLALACKKVDAKMVYISTDYVFDGQGEKPWKPDCKDYKQLNVYGETKLLGEKAVSCILNKYFGQFITSQS